MEEDDDNGKKDGGCCCFICRVVKVVNDDNLGNKKLELVDDVLEEMFDELEEK